MAALFDISGPNFAFRASFNRRSKVTRLSKIFKKLRECVFLPGKSNLAIFFQKEKLFTMKTALKTGYFSVFYVVNLVVKLFFKFFFHKKIDL